MSYKIRINRRPARRAKRNNGERVQRPKDFEARLLTQRGNAAGGVDHDRELLTAFATLDQTRSYVAEQYPGVGSS